VAWRGVIIGFIVGVIAVPVVAILYFILGLAPVATASSPIPLEKFLAGAALHAAIGRSAPKDSPVPATEPNLMAGAKVYRENCAVCHGLPGAARTAIARGEYPKPPQLFEGHGVTDDPAGETFWKTKNGIRLTGMPGFDGALTDEQIWQVSQMLAIADKLPASVQQELRRPDSTPHAESPQPGSAAESRR
jgi:mono/diheme cytochrome c family protein